MLVLGIETSCDETGVALIDSKLGLLSECLYSQVHRHQPYGGVVPEIASRDHVKKLTPLIKQLLKKAALTLTDLDGIAYTKGPGLKGALLVGASIAHSLALSLSIPIIGIHHLEGHLLASFFAKEKPTLPFLGLLVSGGHTLLIRANSPGVYQILGDTLDDAAGEAFDKTAKIMGLSYPGGPILAKLATQGNHSRFHFPRPMINRPGLDFSFSGLKTYALNIVQQHKPLDESTRADIALAFQDAVVDTLRIKCRRALTQTGLKQLVVAGGVGANQALRETLQALLKPIQGQVFYPDIKWCTDNGAMIALAGLKRLQSGQCEQTGIITVNPRWDLTSLAPIE